MSIVARRRSTGSSIGHFLLLTALLIAAAWVLTLTVGVQAISIDAAREAAECNNPMVDIKSPAPFVLAYSISVSGTRADMQMSLVIRKYYLWCFRYKREIPSSRVPAWFNWVWR